VADGFASNGGQGRAWRSDYLLMLPEEAAIHAGSYSEEAATVAGSSEKRRPESPEEAATVAGEVAREVEQQHLGGDPSEPADVEHVEADVVPLRLVAPDAEPPDPAAEVFDVFVAERKRHVKGALDLKPNAARLGKIRARLAEGVTVEQAKDAARGIFRAENHIRDGFKHSTIDVCFRSVEHVDRFIRELGGARGGTYDGRAELDAMEQAGRK
jgi:hypothetical protein